MTTTTNIINAVKTRHIGTPLGALLTGSCDLAQAELADGRTVYITWGRNLTPEQVAAAEMDTSAAMLPGGGCEWIIPADWAEQMLASMHQMPANATGQTDDDASDARMQQRNAGGYCAVCGEDLEHMSSSNQVNGHYLCVGCLADIDAEIDDIDEIDEFAAPN